MSESLWRDEFDDMKRMYDASQARILDLEAALKRIRAFLTPRPCDDWLDSVRDSYYIANDVLGSASETFDVKNK